MKNVLKTKAIQRIAGLIIFAVIIAFSMIACNDRVDDDDNDTVDTGGGEVTGPIYGGRGNGGGAGGGSGSGGGSGGGGSYGVIGKTKDGNNVIVIDTATANSTLKGISKDGTLTFESLQAKYMPAKGDIICSEPSKLAPYGYLYKVKTVATSGGKTTVTTEMARIEEAVKEADDEMSLNLAFSEDGGYIMDGVKVTLIPETLENANAMSRAAASLSEKFLTLRLDLDELDIEKIVKVKGLSLDGYLELSATLNCEVKIEDFTIQKFLLYTEPRFKANLGVSIGGKLEKEIEFKIYEHEFSSIKFLIGVPPFALPVYIVPRITINCTITTEGEVKLSADLASWNYSYALGVQYDTKNKLAGYKKDTSKPPEYLKGLQIELNGGVKLEPRVKFDFGLYGLAFVGVSGGFYGRLAGEGSASIGANADANAKLSLYCGYEYGADASLEILGKTIGELHKTIGENEWLIWEKKWATTTAVAFNGITQNGSASQTTTQLTLAFSQAISGLSASDITLSGVSGVTKGTLISTGSSYILPISGFTSGGTLSVAVKKSGYAISGSPKTVAIYYNKPPTAVTLSSVTQNGSATQTTTQLTLTFSQVISGLAASDITLSGVSGVTKGSLISTGSSYILPISGFTQGGALSVAVIKSGYNISGSPKTVTIYKPSTTIAVTGVSLSKTAAVAVGKTITLTPTITPSNATNQNVEWKSSDTAVATVSSAGVVTGIKAGSAKITVTTKDGGKTAECTVTVSASTVAVTGVSLNKSSTTIAVGKTETLTAAITPSNATNKNVTWSSNKSAVATVSSAGVVTGVSAGSATITVTTEDGKKTATCAVTVSASTIAVTGVSLSKTAAVAVGKTITLTPTITPSNATNQNVEWKSSDTAVATVSSAGVVTGIKAGSAKITVTTKDGGKTAECTVTVNASTVAVTGVSLSNTAAVAVNSNVTLSPTITPSNATNKNVAWSSSDSAVATVSTSGVVTGKSAGKATITVTTEDGGKKAACEVTVTASTGTNVPVTGVSLNKSSTTITVGDKETLTPTIMPGNATNQNVAWESENASVAHVSANGTVTGLSAGTAIIIVTTEDGGKTASCTVTVSASTVAVTGVSLNKTSVSFPVGNTDTLVPTITPSNATNKAVSWSSSDTAVATVSNSGTVTGLSAGTATITVETVDGNYTATADFSVTPGSGTLADPFIVYDVTTLQRVGKGTNAAWTGNWALAAGTYYKQVRDIDMAGQTFTPIGNSGYFYGSYDGGNYKISNLTINATTDYKGLFDRISSGAIVKNVGIVDCNITGGQNVGSVAGTCYEGSTIQNCYSTGTISGYGSLGGIAGGFSGTMQNCYSTCTVTATGGGNTNGGLVGSFGGGKIENCYATGNVSGVDRNGGLVGFCNGTVVQNCYSTGDVSSTGGSNNCAGGLVGFSSQTTIENCYATGVVSVNAYNVGGVVGVINYGTEVTRNCVALNPNISASGTSGYRVGGIGSSGGSNNYGRSDMKKNGVTTTWTDNTTNGRNGEDIEAADWNSGITFWKNKAGFDDTVWDIRNNKLPTLKNMPTARTQDPVVK